MANIKSDKKSILTSKKRNQQNTSFKSTGLLILDISNFIYFASDNLKIKFISISRFPIADNLIIDIKVILKIKFEKK